MFNPMQVSPANSSAGNGRDVAAAGTKKVKGEPRKRLYQSRRSGTFLSGLD